VREEPPAQLNTRALARVADALRLPRLTRARYSYRSLRALAHASLQEQLQRATASAGVVGVDWEKLQEVVNEFFSKSL
jgi:hypothetical protein